MSPRRPRRAGDPTGPSGLLRYVLAWTAGAALILAAAVAFLDRGKEDTVTLPPVRQIQLTAAARSADCDLRAGEGWDLLGLPLAGAVSRRPTAAGVYDRPPDATGLVGALRRGVIVIQHRPDLSDEVIEELRALQEAVPAGTIVTPEAVRTPYAVAAVAWRAVLACGALSADTLDAIRLFRGRFIGSGPDAPQ